VRRVGGKTHYLDGFNAVFGCDPNADNIAKALATYMRTLLSGNSLVDQASYHQKQRGSAILEAQDFEALLSKQALEQISTSLPSKEAARELARGSELFHGKARCYVCHPGPLYTDQGFHNVGVGESGQLPIAGKEPGRFAALPFGLKDRRTIGAFATPSLRDVSRTSPYMHDGSKATLSDVLAYFNDGLKVDGAGYLDDELTLDALRARKLNLSSQELSALELYLRALRGMDLPPAMTQQSIRPR
jgi:cytochrome c peroxidase